MPKHAVTNNDLGVTVCNHRHSMYDLEEIIHKFSFADPSGVYHVYVSVVICGNTYILYNETQTIQGGINYIDLHN